MSIKGYSDDGKTGTFTISAADGAISGITGTVDLGGASSVMIPAGTAEPSSAMEANDGAIQIANVSGTARIYFISLATGTARYYVDATGTV
jgi:hypothetical protein